MALALMFVMIVFSGKALAHGYIDSPSSRADLCAKGVNKKCGFIIYEPQSLEAHKGFPAAGPADGKIASANGAFPELDQQSATRWSKVSITPGTTTFHWTIEANHATTSWKYYITKQNWNPDEPLTRASFDLTPFCSVDYKGKQPPHSYSDTCDVPSRTGYQVILAVWEIADTANAFYNVIDVDFGGGSPVDPTPPAAPANLAVSNVTSTSAILTWDASTDNAGVTGYKIYRGSTLAASTNGSTLTYTLAGLTPSTSYSYSVRAVDAAGNQSASSNVVTFTTLPPQPDTEPPAAPSSLTASAITSSSVTLTWNASTDNVGVAGYRIYNGTALAGTTSGLNYTVSGLQPETSYTFTVVAFDAAGNVSLPSSALNVTTAPAPAATPWAPNTSYAAGALVTYNGRTYEARVAHTSLVGWEPPNVPALWLLK
ncbi:lytic polysaccharide monooxygenase [Paenibacillus thiaminolyticus]|nr:lytic polysaccharide monooxygenase [Paenibacillus thiaminolyticus]MCY9537300.1 lytic polysaccharide monooxygenase [Paenibacillus thiaminolyticus]MCY9606732.1 lytic polysaccharide monooxygenase [Paenibacillus thiaminolyticus]MCY9612810.1 lytic polysaccharide monooxygenase [Paenibacillus thiaminolyticus]MCY9623789.1 lytic polysaccharide monooxygenase [Paenibacillus thiaminolyticus]MCY9637523.1 lytic polysaccharide monooxygenase [Paenibacillus thiaminolyticus]